MSILNWPDKDPDDNRPFAIDWTGALDTQSGIASASWIVPAGIVDGVKSIAGKQTIVWLSGGTAGQSYTITCRITTQPDGWILDQSVRVRVRET